MVVVCALCVIVWTASEGLSRVRRWMVSDSMGACVLMVVGLAGCGWDWDWTTGGGDDGPLVEVACDRVRCDLPDDRSRWVSGGDEAVSCQWDCTELDGRRVYVDITVWSWGGECFGEPEIYTSGCI